MIRRLLPTLLLLVAGLAIHSAHAQILITCAPNVPCNPNTGPAGTSTGMPSWKAFGTANVNFEGFAGMFGASGLLKGNGPYPNPLTAAASGDVVALWTGCNSGSPVLQFDGTCGSGGGGGGGDITSVSITTPSWLTVTGSPCATGACAFQLTATGGLAPNQILATPSGSNGAVSLRSLVAADLPVINLATTGPGGITNILPVANGGTGTATPGLIAGGNVTISGPWPNQTVTASSSGGSGYPNVIDLCTYAGIDPTGATPNAAQVQAAFNAYANTNYTLQLGCPILVHTGSDYTLPVFVPSGLKLQGTPTGKFIVDNVCTNAFIFANTSGWDWRDINVEYEANFGALAIGGTNFGPCSTSTTNLYFTTLENYLIANNGNTFAGGAGPFASGPAEFMGVFDIRGASQHGHFERLHVYSPGGTTTAAAANFAPQVMGFYPEFNNGLAVSSSTALNATTSQIPTDIECVDCDYDGYDMGNVQIGSNIRFINFTGKRYSDLQDGTGGTITFTGNLTAGDSSETLSANWALPTGTYCQTLNQPSFVATGSSISGTTLTLGTVTSGRVDIGDSISGSGVTGGTTITAGSGLVWTVSSSQTVSGTTISGVAQIGMLLTNGSTAANTFINCVTGASSTIPASSTSAVTASGNVGGINNWFAPPHMIYMWSQSSSFPANGWPYSVNGSNIQDLGPYVGLATRRSTGSGTALSLKFEPSNGSGFDGYLSLRPDGFLDLESGQSGGGYLRNVTAHYNSTLATANSGIPWLIRTPQTFAYTNFDFSNSALYDDAASPAAFPIPAAIGNNASSGISITGMKVYLNNWGGSWTPGFQLEGNNERLQAEIYFATCTSTSTFTGSIFQQGNNLVTNSNIEVDVYGWRPFTGSNYNANINRIVLNKSGGGIGNHARLRDISNQWQATADEFVTKEEWTQSYVGTSMSGSSIDTGINFPTSFAFDGVGWAVSTAITGVTGGVNVGVSGHTSQLLSAANTSTSNVGVPAFSPIAASGTDVLLSPASGSFTGGSATLSVHGTSLVGTH